MDEYRSYLAQQLLTEDKLVSYRLLSRALKVHVNVAKEMLYDFHKWQNDKKPGTLHATYLVYGAPKTVGGQDGDVEMTNSQSSEDPQNAFSDPTPVQTLTLVKEEHLQDLIAQYEQVTSIQVYSLAPHPLKDLQLLADTARQVLEVTPRDEDPAAATKTYGSITNPNVRKRTRNGPPPKPASATAVPKKESKPQPKQEPEPVATAPKKAVKEEPKTTAAAPAKDSKEPSESSAPSVAKKSSAAPSLKRQGSSSGIGQMFAKAATKAKKPAAPAESKPAAPPPADEDTTMAMSDDGEDDAEPTPDTKQDDASSRQTRKDRQAELRRMMDESDDEEKEEAADEKVEEPVDEPMEESAPDPEPEPEPKAEEPAEVVASSGDGRRRGRRRVTRKKQIMDDQGYLVTIQEPGWESFSEEEAPAPAPPKPKPTSGAQQQPAAKPKKPAGKAGQGNIMSFFSKK